jgi:hypothetical protein
LDCFSNVKEPAFAPGATAGRPADAKSFRRRVNAMAGQDGAASTATTNRSGTINHQLPNYPSLCNILYVLSRTNIRFFAIIYRNPPNALAQKDLPQRTQRAQKEDALSSGF